jgi:CxxC motif-containing protein (DUF1111 family)
MSRGAVILGGALVAGGVVGACTGASSAPTNVPTAADLLSGGTTTVFDTTSGAYGNQAPDLTSDEAETFSLGHATFERDWVTAPATTSDIDGLGPLFNQRSCSACHSHDGRSAPFAADGTTFLGMLFRLSVPGMDEHGGPLGDPVYGLQLRPGALLGVPPDGTPQVSYQEVAGTYGDGTSFSLQTPSYSVTGWNYGDPSSDLLLSPRVGPIMVGLGLLEAIPEQDLLAGVRSSADADGVLGKANHVWSATRQATVVGRFGWKANVDTVLDQIAGALQGDIGITSSLFPDETCTPAMTACLAAPNGGMPEVSPMLLTALSQYSETLAVPARRTSAADAGVDGEQDAARGEALFGSFGCTSCHKTTFVTGDFPALPQVAGQTIHPYSDLLLHDMGAGLADGRPDFEASGSEWRTPPLWGLGLLRIVNGHQLLMHDARARGVAEAILWHGGEAEAARERFRAASASDRDALVSFVNSL